MEVCSFVRARTSHMGIATHSTHASVPHAHAPHPLSSVDEGIRRSSSPHVGRTVARTRVCSSARSHQLSSTSARPQRLSSLSALAPSPRTLSTRLTLQDPSTSVVYARVSVIHVDLDRLHFQLRPFARLPPSSADSSLPNPSSAAHPPSSAKSNHCTVRPRCQKEARGAHHPRHPIRSPAHLPSAHHSVPIA